MQSAARCASDVRFPAAPDSDNNVRTVMEVELQKTTFSPWARTASVMSFSAVMIFLTLGGGRWLLPTLAKYIPTALLG